MADVTDIGPLDWRIAITDKNGRPTPEFQRRWNSQRGNNALIGTISFGSGPPPGSPPPADGAEYADTSNTPYVIYVGNGGVWNKSGVSDFTELLDVPHAYTASPNYIVRVNVGMTALEFTSPSSLTANPTATAGSAAVNGTAATFMRSDASPAVQIGSAASFGIVKADGTSVLASGGVISVPTATSAAFGIMKPDNTTITIAGGVISAVGGGGGGGSPKWAWAQAGCATTTSIVITPTGTFSGTPAQAAQIAPTSNFFWGTNTSATITFDFGQSVVISGVGFIQDTAAANGTWQVAGSTNNVTYTNLGSPGAWGGATYSSIVFTNTTSYRYYKLTQTAGTTSNGPYQQMFLFKWA